MGVQTQQDYLQMNSAWFWLDLYQLSHLFKVRVVNMSHNMKQKLLNLLEDSLEIGGELVAVLGREHGLVIDHLLDVGHDVVDVLRGRELALLALVIQPHVEPGPGPRHLRARAQVTKLRHRPVKQVYVLEKSDSCEKKYLY